MKTLGAVPVPGSLLDLDASGLASLMSGNDIVVFSAGAGGAGIEPMSANDGRGLKLAAEATFIAGIHPFILVSVLPDVLREQESSASF
ncbi:hypothetical protein [Microvirga massiliensis]|uniref:hypothetical protein n=1 Tax=Microvirga massiliensis TaxID=1033741 RepID=UPI00069A9428|nr:hypothetical protein [Microvirga massiliensis]